MIGPWFHIPWKPFVGAHSEDASPNLVDDWQLAWFDLHLKGVAERRHEPLVSLFVMGEERWRDFDSWPPAKSEPVSYYLHSGGPRQFRVRRRRALDRPARPGRGRDIFTYDPLFRQPARAAIPAVSISSRRWDRRIKRDRKRGTACWSTPPRR